MFNGANFYRIRGRAPTFLFGSHLVASRVAWNVAGCLRSPPRRTVEANALWRPTTCRRPRFQRVSHEVVAWWRRDWSPGGQVSLEVPLQVRSIMTYELSDDEVEFKEIPCYNHNIIVRRRKFTSVIPSENICSMPWTSSDTLSDTQIYFGNNDAESIFEIMFYWRTVVAWHSVVFQIQNPWLLGPSSVWKHLSFLEFIPFSNIFLSTTLPPWSVGDGLK